MQQDLCSCQLTMHNSYLIVSEHKTQNEYPPKKCVAPLNTAWNRILKIHQGLKRQRLEVFQSMGCFKKKYTFKCKLSLSSCQEIHLQEYKSEESGPMIAEKSSGKGRLGRVENIWREREAANGTDDLLTFCNFL